MAVADLPPFVTYPVAGTGPYAVPFPLRAAGDLVVQGRRADGTLITLAWQLVAGSVQLLAAPAASVTAVQLSRRTPREQPVSLRDQAPVPAATVEGAFDRAALALQEVSAGLDTAMRLPLGENAAPLPPAAIRAGKWLAFDPSGSPVMAATEAAGVPVTAFAAGLLAAPGQAQAQQTLGVWSTVQGAVRAEDYVSSGMTATQRRLAFQAALAECAASGRYLSIPSGTYAVDGEKLTVPSGVTIEARRGISRLQTSVDRAPTKPVIELTGSHARLVGLSIESTFAGDPNVSDTNAAIVVTGSDCVVEGFEVSGRFYVGVTNRGAARTVMADGRVRGARNRGIYNYLGVTDSMVRNVGVDGNDIGTSTPYTYYCFNTNPGGTAIATNVRYRDCVGRSFLFHGLALSERCGPGSVHGCHMETTAAGAVGMVMQDANSFLLEDGMFSMNSCYGGLVGFYVVGSMFSILNSAIARDQTGAGAAGFIFVDSNYLVATGLISRQFTAQSGIQLTATAADSMRRTMIGPAVTLGGNYGAFVTGAATNSSRDIVFIGLGGYGHPIYGFIADNKVDRLAVVGSSFRGSAINVDITGATNTATAGNMIG